MQILTINNQVHYFLGLIEDAQLATDFRDVAWPGFAYTVIHNHVLLRKACIKSITKHYRKLPLVIKRLDFYESRVVEKIHTLCKDLYRKEPGYFTLFFFNHNIMVAHIRRAGESLWFLSDLNQRSLNWNVIQSGNSPRLDAIWALLRTGQLALEPTDTGPGIDKYRSQERQWDLYAYTPSTCRPEIISTSLAYRIKKIPLFLHGYAR